MGNCCQKETYELSYDLRALCIFDSFLKNTLTKNYYWNLNGIKLYLTPTKIFLDINQEKIYGSIKNFTSSQICIAFNDSFDSYQLIINKNGISLEYYYTDHLVYKKKKVY